MRTSFETLARMDGRLRRVGPLQRLIIEELANLPDGAYADEIAFVLAVPERSVKRSLDRLYARGILASRHFVQIVLKQ